MTTDKHVDPAAPVVVADEEDSNLTDVPEGTVRFELDPEEIAQELAAPSLQVCEVPSFVRRAGACRRSCGREKYLDRRVSIGLVWGAG